MRPGNWLRPVAALVIAAVCCPGAPAQAPNSLPRILPAPAEEAGPALESPPGAEAPPAGPATPIPAEAQPPSPGGDVPSEGASPAATPAAAGEPWKPILLPVWE
ncbi:MAG TPA: hypothetical protein VIL46_07400, partial [Gemmataceae bacterium]